MHFVGDRFYSQILKGNDDEIQQLPKYSIPKPSVISPIPKDDYSSRFFIRYFMRRVNGSNISEISRETFNDLSQGIKYNSALYVTTSLSWSISGQLETTIRKWYHYTWCKTSKYGNGPTNQFNIYRYRSVFN
jgi:hypothetical protein